MFRFPLRLTETFAVHRWSPSSDGRHDPSIRAAADRARWLSRRAIAVAASGWSLARSFLGTRAEPVGHPYDAAIDELLADLDRLGAGGAPPTAVARTLAPLWDTFQARFGGVGGFLSAAEAERGDYVDRLRAAAERMRAARLSAQEHFYLATALMALYLACWHEDVVTPSSQALSARVAALINLGRAGPARSASLADATAA